MLFFKISSHIIELFKKLKINFCWSFTRNPSCYCALCLKCTSTNYNIEKLYHGKLVAFLIFSIIILFPKIICALPQSSFSIEFVRVRDAWSMPSTWSDLSNCVSKNMVWKIFIVLKIKGYKGWVLIECQDDRVWIKGPLGLYVH